MRRRFFIAAGAAAFVALATANSGGYRYGVSDQAFYIPAIAHGADPSLFPRDAGLLAPQMKWWLGDEVLGAIVRTTGLELPSLFVLLYVTGLVALYAAGMFLARGFEASAWAMTGAAALMTLRHRIPKTGANSLEGYTHPRMIAFAIGLFSLGFLVRRRPWLALALVALAAGVHPTTALWFGVLWILSLLARLGPGPIRTWLWILIAMALLVTVRLVAPGPRFDGEWLEVVGQKDYLFSHEWPPYAWVLNLLYPTVIWLIYRRRRNLGVLAGRERELVFALMTLVLGFLLSVPVAAAHIPEIVQLQVNRIFWILDGVVAVYLGWWLIDDLAPRRNLRQVAAAVLVLIACARGIFILVDTGRALVTLDLADNEWTATMRWLREQPADWHVLADPGHGWMFGTSVRAAALRDTVLESGKDSAMAMYDEGMARRVAARMRDLDGFAQFDTLTMKAVGRTYGAHVVVVESRQGLTLPVLYENPRFKVYDLR